MRLHVYEVKFTVTFAFGQNIAIHISVLLLDLVYCEGCVCGLVTHAFEGGLSQLLINQYSYNKYVIIIQPIVQYNTYIYLIVNY